MVVAVAHQGLAVQGVVGRHTIQQGLVVLARLPVAPAGLEAGQRLL